MSETNAFMQYLRSLVAREDRGALAALRRGLGQPPGAAAEMHPHVARFVPDGGWTWRSQCLYIVAALFGLHPAAGGKGNFGDTFRLVADRAGGDSVEKRFVAVLKCHRDDLFDHLRHAVSLAKSKDAAINYEQLIKDIRFWHTVDGNVQRNWSRRFWGRPASQENTTTQPQGVEE